MRKLEDLPVFLKSIGLFLRVVGSRPHPVVCFLRKGPYDSKMEQHNKGRVDNMR